MTPRRYGLWLAALPGSALAHSPIEGLNSFYNGVLHPALVPLHLVLVIGLGLLFGRQLPAVARPAIAAFLAATLLGLGALVTGLALPLELALLLGALLVGALLAADLQLPARALAVLAALLGLGIGLDSAPEAPDRLAWWLMLAGNALGVTLGIAAGLLLAEKLSAAGWQRVAVRVVGSWIAASTFMVMALTAGQAAGPGPAPAAATSGEARSAPPA